MDGQLDETNATARYINIALGIWLFVSAFLWPHSQAQATNTWIIGALIVIFAAAGLRYPQARYVNAILAIWLFISVWALPTITAGTMWNNALVAIAVFLVSLAPGYAGRGGRPITGG